VSTVADSPKQKKEEHQFTPGQKEVSRHFGQTKPNQTKTNKKKRLSAEHKRKARL